MLSAASSSGHHGNRAHATVDVACGCVCDGMCDVVTEEDRRERRRKLGLPEELTPEEKPVTVLDKLRSCLVDMKKQHSSQEEVWKTAGTTLLRYLTNISNQPDEEKFRSIRTTNAAFQQRVAAAHGSMQFLEHCGFTVEGEALVLARDKLNPDVIQGGIAALQDMLGNPFFGCL
ncbi:predicted protein [Haematococcus lacustris]|uniref:PUB domain-containing protein n=1 Tax=Haematococcus lacustris TaxID=44745 RepID=A0A699YV98_HAELA|nr:predicted protein [Haematococcus lacustris]